ATNAPSTPTTPAPAAPAAPFVSQQRKHDPDAKILEIGPDEKRFIENLAPILDPSPRALKRFVNVYRLLKASLSPDEQRGFTEGDAPLDAPYKKVLLLLAIANGLPSLSTTLFRRLAGLRPEALSHATLEHVFRSSPMDSGVPAGDLSVLEAWLDRLETG